MARKKTIRINRKSVLISCDPGIDDALALVLAFASPELKIDSIVATYGNSSVSKTLGNLLKIFAVANVKRIPNIGKGSSQPLEGKAPKRVEAHGKAGLADEKLKPLKRKIKIKEGISLIIERLLGDKVDAVIALGPLTDIARAVRKEPRLKSKIKELIILGGMLKPIPGFDSSAEFNMSCDPVAAEEILNSGIAVKLITQDIAKRVVLKEKDLSALRNIDNKLSEFILNISSYSVKFYKKVRKKKGAFLNDPLAVAVAVNSRLALFRNAHIGVDVKGERGRIFLKKGRPNISLCKSVDTEKFLKLFKQRVIEYCRTGYN